jgi:hypothetical protein
MATALDPSGIIYSEYYLYSDKVWEAIPSGVTFFNLSTPVQQNAPIVVTSSGYEVELTSPWAKTQGTGKWEKVGFGSFTTKADGTYDTAHNEFALQPDASGKLIFNKMLGEHLYVEYEGGPSGYYTMTSLDYNPIRNEVGGGFVHFSRVYDATSLFITSSQGSILADGFQGCTLTATLYDKNFDRVADKDIIFEMLYLTNSNWAELGNLLPTHGIATSLDASGVAYKIKETTNGRGEARAKYVTHYQKAGVQWVKAYYNDASGISDITNFAQYFMSVAPFTLDISMLDSLDYLTADYYALP